MSDSRITPELIELKNKQRIALKKEYWKQVTNPHAPEVGHVFDPAVQRFMSMKATNIDFFRETPKTILRGLFLLVLPIAGTIYMFKYDRDKKEAAYRSGQVAYKDRLFKFV
ncbi:NADH dehydrogenase (ubiquinone) B15 subunit [Rhodnius prolixus]|uniref:NADH dehydrogenase [ubiquinone] 1 beta subcomplex subunit 4 n=2 Tax=Rhodnius TaxID=13248 RepID=R4G4D9_RHOPR